MYPSTPYASHPNADASGPYAYAYSARPTPLPPQPLQAPFRKGAAKKKSSSLFFLVFIGFIVGAAAFTTMKVALPEARASHAPTFVLPEPPPSAANVATVDPSSVPPVLSAAPPAFTGAVATPAPVASTDKSEKAGADKADKKDPKPRKRAKAKTAAPVVAAPVAVPHNPYEG